MHRDYFVFRNQWVKAINYRNEICLEFGNFQSQRTRHPKNSVPAIERCQARSGMLRTGLALIRTQLASSRKFAAVETPDD